MPSPLFNALFVIALIVPVTMYVIGVAILMISIVVRHFGTAERHARPLEAIAH